MNKILSRIRYNAKTCTNYGAIKKGEIR